MKGIYLAAFEAKHENYNLIYQDINGKRDIDGDMLETPLDDYDFIIATPPCNYYSKARGNRKPSKYALNTKHLLPAILDKLRNCGKPYIVENVRNAPLFNKQDMFSKADFVYFVGRHTYWTNIPFNTNNISQEFDFSYGGVRLNNNTQGGQNVHNVIEKWLGVIHERKVRSYNGT